MFLFFMRFLSTHKDDQGQNVSLGGFGGCEAGVRVSNVMSSAL